MLIFRRSAFARQASGAASAIVMAVALIGLSACHKKPGGQIVAVVNGQEITQEEMRAEAQTMHIPAGTDPKTVDPIILQRVIERTLLAGYAHQAGLDRGPDYIARLRLLDQSLLAELALHKLAGTQQAPTAAEIQTYIDQHPTLFAKRQQLTLDQVRFATPADHAALQALTKSPTMDAVIARLKASNTNFTRTPVNVNTGTLDPAVAQQIVALSNGEVFDLSNNGQTFISVITARADAPSDPAGWPAAARTVLERERAMTVLKNSVDKLRSAAKIQYDPAFAPPKKP